MKEGHKMDCGTGRGYRLPVEVLMAPTVLSVKDEKHHVVCHTIVDYNRLEDILDGIKDLLERNHWHHEVTVLPSEGYFLNYLASKDISQ
jgi:hypothetical protein